MLLSHPRHLLAALSLGAAVACGGSSDRPDPVEPDPQPNPALVTCPAAGTTGGPPTSPAAPGKLAVLGHGRVTDRFTAEVWARGNYAYTSSWSRRGSLVGNVVRVWDVAGAAPRSVACVEVPNATTTGDLEVSDDGRLLVVATERAGGSIAIYDVQDPAAPKLLTQYSTPNTTAGVHTAEVERVNGTLYAFLSIDPGPSEPAKLVIVDLSTPSAPREVFARAMGNPFVHDVFVRDGLLFTALWNDGLTIWDIGGGARGGSPAAPVQLGTVRTVGGEAHNVYWFHDPTTSSKRYAFVGEEGAGQPFVQSSGDVHVIDLSDLAAPREVAYYSVAGAGTHNFSVDEPRGVLYAAYYNGGVRALDVRGDLGSCTAEQKSPDGRCDLSRMGRELARGLTDGGGYVWGVHYLNDAVYASDMQWGLYKLGAVVR
jgi:hypothetical protein